MQPEVLIEGDLENKKKHHQYAKEHFCMESLMVINIH